MRILVALVALFGLGAASSNISVLCGAPEAQLSCGQCIKQHPQCAWCGDPHAITIARCQQKNALTENICNQNYVYSPTTEMRIPPHGLPLQSMHNDGRTVVQLEPQQVFLKMKHGDKLEVPFKYLHRRPQIRTEVRDMYIQTSEHHQGKGVNLKFFVNCNGTEVQDRICPNVEEGRIYTFKVEVTMDKCSSEGDISISVGIYGYSSVGALYISPMCGCDCEKIQRQERNSPLCHNHGTLICGQCVCENTRGGDRCECPLATYGVSNAMELEDKCRPSSSAQLCNGNGQCQCGQCRCNSNVFTGKFCECDNTSCPKNVDGVMCSGNGVCECGQCSCEHGWERDDCSCSSNTATCMESGVECSGHGHCECGKCVCDAGYTGAFCGAEETMVHPELEHQPEQEEETEDSTPKIDESDEEEKEGTEEKTADELEDPEVSNTEEVSSSSSPSSFSIILAHLFLILPAFF